MTENTVAIEIYTSRYAQYGNFIAECHGCAFRKVTKTSPQIVVKRHVQHTGHTVEVRRAQFKIVRPA